MTQRKAAAPKKATSPKAQSLPTETDVLIVGYGPVGAALIALLGRYGINTVAVDKEKDILQMPRAIALDNEALRALQMVGLGEDAFERIAIPEVKMHCPYLGQFGKVNTKGSIDGHPKLVTFYQPDLEKALRLEASKQSCTSFCPGLELLEFEEDGKSVLATLQSQSGDLHRIRARYIIGADGASSRVRALIGQGFEGETYAEDWLIVDARERQNKAIDHVEFICNPKRPTPHMPAPGGRERWEFMLQPGETLEEMESPEKLAELLAPWIHPKDLVTERKAIYRFHARCCEQFQKGRAFLVGHAAHITPPFVGQGLVAGLRDAANLGWKLAWVLRGHASPRLLESYDQERRPHAKKMIELAKLMGHLVMPRGRATAVAVHGAMRVAGLVSPVRQQLEELKIKPPNRFDKGVFASEQKQHEKLKLGGPIAQDVVRQGERICLSDEVLGDQFTLVGFGVDPCIQLNDRAIERWQSISGQFLQIGMRGQKTATDTTFAEDLSDNLVPGLPLGWVAVVRPDRVLMHAGPAEQGTKIVNECLSLLTRL